MQRSEETEQISWGWKHRCWHKRRTDTRHQVLHDLQKMCPPDELLSDARLEKLLEQVLEAQANPESQQLFLPNWALLLHTEQIIHALLIPEYFQKALKICIAAYGTNTCGLVQMEQCIYHNSTNPKPSLLRQYAVGEEQLPIQFHKVILVLCDSSTLK